MSGMLQGIHSLLGPVLFQIFISDMHDVVKTVINSLQTMLNYKINNQSDRNNLQNDLYNLQVNRIGQIH